MGTTKVMEAKVSTKGWIVIPAALRKRYGLKPGTSVEFREHGNKIFIIPRVSDVVEALYGKFSREPSLTKALLEDRAKELEREESQLRTG
jgi:AbrB family looped-hinge helix DNA binding protein